MVYAPSSETSLKVPFKSHLNSNATPKTYSQKNGNANLTLRIERDTIYAAAKCDSLAIVAKIKQEYLSESNKIKEASDNQETVAKGVSVFKTILYALSGFIIGLGVGVLLKTLKLI